MGLTLEEKAEDITQGQGKYIPVGRVPHQTIKAAKSQPMMPQTTSYH